LLSASWRFGAFWCKAIFENAPKTKGGQGIIKLYQSRSYHFAQANVRREAVLLGVFDEQIALIGDTVALAVRRVEVVFREPLVQYGQFLVHLRLLWLAVGGADKILDKQKQMEPDNPGHYAGSLEQHSPTA
jgi:hypothetical protein